MKSFIEIMWKSFVFWGSLFILLGMSMQFMKVVVNKDIGIQLAAGGFVCLWWAAWGAIMEMAIEEHE